MEYQKVRITGNVCNPIISFQPKWIWMAVTDAGWRVRLSWEDLELVFRPSNKVLPFAQAAVAIGAKALWLQQGITHPEARRLATEAGILYVEDECAAVVRSIHDIHKTQAK